MDAKIIKMKYSFLCRVLLIPLVMLIVSSNIIAVSGGESFRTHFLQIVKADDYIQLVNTNISVLKDFTLCVDINLEMNVQEWPVFTYRELDSDSVNPGNPDFGLVGTKESLKIYFSKHAYEFQIKLPENCWHSLCSTWDSGKVELYVNGSMMERTKNSVYASSDNVMQVKGNGTLVLGINHINHRGSITQASIYSLYGNIYNFQLWDYTLSPELLTKCFSGNVVNWTRKIWKFKENRVDEDKSLRCANSEDILSTASTTTHRTSLETSTSVLSLTTTKISELPTTTRITQNANVPTTTYSTSLVTSTSADQTSSKINSTLEPNKPTGFTTVISNISSTSTTNQESQSISTTPSLVDITTNESSLNTSLPKSSSAANTGRPFSTSSTTRTRTPSHASSSTSSGTTTLYANYTTSPQNSSTTISSNMDTSLATSTIKSEGSMTTIQSTSSTLNTTTEGSTTTMQSTSSTLNTNKVEGSMTTIQSTSSTLNTTTEGSTTTMQSTSSTLNTNKVEGSMTTIQSTSSTLNTTTEGSTTTMQSTSSTLNTNKVEGSMTTIQSTSSTLNTTKAEGSTTTLQSTSSTLSTTTTEGSMTTMQSTSSTLNNTKAEGSTTTTQPTSSTLKTTKADGSMTTTQPTSSSLNATKAENSATTLRSTSSTLSTTTEGSMTTMQSTSSTLNTAKAEGSTATLQSTSLTLNTTTEGVKTSASNTPSPTIENGETSVSNSPSPTGTVIYFVVRMDITISVTNGNDDDIANITNRMLDKIFKGTEFSVVQFVLQNEASNESKAIIKAISSDSSESLDSKLKKLLEDNNYSEEGLLQSVSVNSVKLIGNAKYLAIQISNFTSNVGQISKNNTKIILTKISEIAETGESDISTAQTNLDTLESVLQKSENVREYANTILTLTEEIGYKMNYPGETANISTQTLALFVSSVNFTEFKDIFFAVKSYHEGMNPEITLENEPIDKTVAFIYLPGAIKDNASTITSKVQFNFFGKTSLFEDSIYSNIMLNTYVVSASVENTEVQQLREPVDISLKHIYPNNINYQKDSLPVHCVFWDFHRNGVGGYGLGGWSTSGCNMTYTNINYTTCHCTHLTHFGVLLEERARDRIAGVKDEEYIPILSLLTYVGCGIASIFLGVSLVTYLTFKQLRRDYPSKILMNMSASLLMLNLHFLVNTWISNFQIHGLCITSAALLHYLLLTSFTWLGLEAVHMYFAFVKVFNLYIHNYILKFCIAGWGIPAFIVAIILAIDIDSYGIQPNGKASAVSPDNSDLFCWIQNDLVFYITVVAYFCVMFLANISMFIVVLIQINSLNSKRKKDWKALFLRDIKNTLSLTFLLGLTWGFAFFALGPVRSVFLYLFSISNTLQGFFIFVFHCLLKENVRQHWKRHLCCGRFRLDNYSDWSKLSNAEARQNSHIRTSPSDSFQSTRSNETASTSNASSLSGFYSADYPGRSYSNGGLFINPAHLDPPNQMTIHPERRKTLTFLDIK
ncbi:adhesion G- coupled receptor G4 [Pelobates cultripes]|uniref:Adhesion G- coupled receptor G4 n=1 Tax=Pelobates cultripes TaxID=61616 RepID=A0AAD1SZR2_PELCU|nr:adhesion G- coupled receptor G4 [Pelobates cultripes]